MSGLGSARSVRQAGPLLDAPDGSPSGCAYDAVSGHFGPLRGGGVQPIGSGGAACGERADVSGCPHKKIEVRILGFGQARVEAAHMPAGPAPAAKTALEQAGVSHPTRCHQAAQPLHGERFRFREQHRRLLDSAAAASPPPLRNFCRICLVVSLPGWRGISRRGGASRWRGVSWTRRSCSAIGSGNGSFASGSADLRAMRHPAREDGSLRGKAKSETRETRHARSDTRRSTQSHADGARRDRRA